MTKRILTQTQFAEDAMPMRRLPVLANARSGARTMYEMRRFSRKCMRERIEKGERIPWLVRGPYQWFPRIAFHSIYLRRFGLRHWLFDGR